MLLTGKSRLYSDKTYRTANSFNVPRRKNSSGLDVRGSVHRDINLIERTNKMQPEVAITVFELLGVSSETC
jgi:hypothetical protein